MSSTSHSGRSRIINTNPSSTQIQASREPSVSSRCRKASETSLGSNYRVQIPVYHSNVEQNLIRSQTPLVLPNAGHIQAGQYTGLHLNKDEELAFSGPVPLSQYPINQDCSPEIIRKKSLPVKYQQKVSVRHLNPPCPSPHGDLIVREVQRQIPAAPPLIVRQEGCRACTPPPIIYREAPPQPPAHIPTQIVEVEGEPIPPPPRRVIYERMSDQPAKPQNIIIEKWLPYKPQARRVVFQRSCAPPLLKPRNLVIEWEQPCVEVEQVYYNLGVCDTDPKQYIQQYGCELKQSHEIPNFFGSSSMIDHSWRSGWDAATAFSRPKFGGLTRSASASSLSIKRAAASSGRCCRVPLQQRSSRTNIMLLEGDIDALRRVDLERYGLQEYRQFI